MRTETVTRQIGEYLGPVDWSYDFTQHNWDGTHGGINPEVIDKSVRILRLLEAGPDQYEATTDGGWPKVGWKKVLQVGMYDGWPFWKPTPSVLLSGPLGAEWHSWYSISAIEKFAPTGRTNAEGSGLTMEDALKTMLVLADMGEFPADVTKQRYRKLLASTPPTADSQWRVGKQVPLNVYEGNRPVCQCHTEEDARRIVEAVNGRS